MVSVVLLYSSLWTVKLSAILLMLAKMFVLVAHKKRMIQISLLMWNIAFSMFQKWCRWNSWYQCCNADTISLSLFYLFSFHHIKTIWSRIWHQLWKCKRFYKINDVYLRITPEQQLALMFFFPFTGCGWYYILDFWHMKEYLMECMVPEFIHH